MAQWGQIEHEAPSGNRIQAMVHNGRGQVLVLIPGTWGNAQTRTPLVEKPDRDVMLVCVALAGQDDNWPPHRKLMRISDRGNIQLEWIAGTSRNLHVEAPERLADLMNAFMKAVSGSSPAVDHDLNRWGTEDGAGALSPPETLSS